MLMLCTNVHEDACPVGSFALVVLIIRYHFVKQQVNFFLLTEDLARLAFLDLVITDAPPFVVWWFFLALSPNLGDLTHTSSELGGSRA